MGMGNFQVITLGGCVKMKFAYHSVILIAILHDDTAPFFSCETGVNTQKNNCLTALLP